MTDESTSEQIDRRKFLKVLGVTGGGALALSGCSTDRVTKLIPYLVQSEDQVPGVATYYASTCTECHAGCGLHVKTREARAIKLEGNPEHPVNAGKLCARGQAGLQGLYNPGRLKGPKARAADGSFQEITWDEAINRLADKVGAARGKIAVITGAAPGTFSDLLSAWTTALGGQVVRYHAFDHEPMRAANRQVFGIDELPAYDFAKARYIVSFGADFLETWLAPVEHQRGFAESHGYQDGQMGKHVAFGPRMSLTGMNADEWHAIRPGSDAVLALAMANLIMSERTGAPADANGLRGVLAPHTPEAAAQETGLPAEAIKRIAREFASAKPSLAVAGGVGNQHRGATELCAAVNILNYVAGNVGQTVNFGAALAAGDGYGSMNDLAKRLDAGEVTVVLVHEANPIYSLPKSSKFSGKFAKATFKVSTSLFLDETARECDLLLPGHHALERWDDARPRRGVTGLMQPVMQPVFNTMATGDVLLKVAQRLGGPLASISAPSFEAYLKTAWQTQVPRGSDFDTFWRGALQRGGVYGSAPATPVRLAPGAQQVGYHKPAFDGTETAGDFIFSAYPTSMLHDGRGANRPWLLEMSDPVTKITWHSWVEIHPDVARDLDVQEGEILRLTSPFGSIEAPAYVYPGLHPGLVAVPLGLGHTEFGEYAKGRGVNALDLLNGEAPGGFLPYLATRVSVAKTGKYQRVAKTEGNVRQLGRGIADALTLEQARSGVAPALAEKAGGHEGEENPPREVAALKGWREEQQEEARLGAYAQDFPKWAMVVDLARCTGCSACVTACYAENNIPTVGPEQILRGREMTWIRIERYYEGGESPGEPLETRFVPVMCQHCGNAPCEPVCPVYAAYHTADGLNGQVYNRCVGTRYCSNNCPYKVRYFNWLAYGQQAFREPLNLQLNPDVTVRARGVMEKCTFCVQRIRGAQNQARMEDRTLADGDVVTACAQACPSSAIVFGNIKDPGSRVARLASDQRGYHLLEDLNVRPSVTYLAKVLHEAEG
ncbi:MAG TPA: molybdopterin-dependent oxidoreductase [Gemmatimonadales bacterium]|nr:molybdopterin-dependent oxidoreductase [Gemmatimonadales bacterium]